jgi:hypothetical protein
MGIFEKARQAAEQAADATRQAADETRRRAEGAAATLSDPTTQEKAKLALDSAGKQTKVGLGHARRGISTAIDKIDPNILADMIIKATSLQEKANAALRDKGSPYRVAEIGIAASIPPQVTFSIGRIDDPEQAPPAADLIESTELLEDSPLDDMEIVSLDGTVVLDLEPADGPDAEAAPGPAAET